MALDAPRRAGKSIDVFPGDTEMAALMRRTDWAATPIGPAEQWPQSLRTAVSICLDSRFPIILFWGPELVMLYNDAYRPILGETKHPAAMGQRARDCFPEIWDVVGPMLNGVLSGGDATWSEDQLLVLDRNGYSEECYFTFSYSPIREEGDRIGGVFTAVTETTARVVGERRVHTLQGLSAGSVRTHDVDEACRRAAETLSLNPADVPFAALYLLDAADGTPRLAATAGIPPDDEAALERLRAVTRDDTSPLARACADGGPMVVRALETGLGALPGGAWPESPTIAYAAPIAASDSERPVGLLLAGISPRRALDDDYRAFLELVAVHLGATISNARAAEAERQRTESLVELDRAKTAFFSNVSHEFRTPLTLMLGPAEDALTDLADPLSPGQRERLALLRRNGLRLQKLVNTLLDFSRIEAGRVQATYVPTDIAAYTAELASIFRAAVEQAGIHLVLDCPSLPEPVYLDREMWEKIVLNLLSNALKFTFAGEIAVVVNGDAAHVTVTVRDTGAGIPAAELPRLFERFHRVAGTRGRTQEGSGIGLALVQELVRLHGGTIAVSSEQGAGTTFAITLPTGTAHLPTERVVAAATASAGSAAYVEEALRWLPDGADEISAASAADPLDHSGLHAVPGPVPRVLLADDNADMREYVGRLLGSQYEVEMTGDGLSALAAALERVPDAIVSDVMMPGLDGFGLVRALRNDPRTRTVPVILLSARAGEGERVEGVRAGADDYLVKPFSARELLARVGARVELSRMQAELARRERELRREAEATRQRLYDLFMQAPAFICVLEGPDHRFAFLNTRYQQLLGPRDLLGLPVRTSVPEAEGQGYFELLDTVYRTGEPFVGDATLLQLDRTGTGVLENLYVTFVYQPTRAADGRVNGIFVTGLDVTEQVQARREVQQLADANAQLYREAQDALGERDAFVSAVSHDLKTPLTTIGGMTALLQRRAARLTAADGARIGEGLATIQSATRTMTAMVSELVDLSRLQSGQRLELDIAPVDLVELARRAVALVQATASRRDIRLTTTVETLHGLWDGDRLERVLGNLLTNAVKYSPDGGVVTVALDHTETDDGAWVLLAVSDEGMGIPAADLPHVFERFYRGTNVAGRISGSGIGLAGSLHIVEQHGGSITAVSREGVGTTMTVRLPLA